MKRSRFTDSQVMAVLKHAESGTPVPELSRQYGISTATFYKWRSKFGGMDVSLMAKTNELEDENRRLKKMVVDAQMRALIVEEGLADQAKETHGAGEACHADGSWVHQPGMVDSTPKQRLAMAAPLTCGDC